MEKRKKMFGVCQGKSDSSSVNGTIKTGLLFMEREN